MEKSFGLLFFLRKPKRYCNGEIPIYMRVTVDGIAIELSTRRKCDPEKWSVNAARMNGKTEPVKLFNAYLDTLQQKVFEAKRKLMEVDKEVTAENIKNILMGIEIGKEKHMLMEVFVHHNEQMKALVGTEFAEGTLERYQTSFRHTQSFLKARYKVNDIDIIRLDHEFIAEYEYWLRSTRKCGHNSTMKYLSNFKKIVNRCLRNGWLPKDPFMGFKITKREVDRTALTETELDMLATKELHVERLRIVRDIFLFSCYSGLAYADVKKLKRSDIFIGIDGNQWLFSKRQKTDVSARIPLLPVALDIMKKYNDHIQCKLGDFVLPVLSNQKMNAYLKEIADLCGIGKKLTYHIARHTFATTVTLSNGVPIETVSKMLGHRNLKTTQHYAKIVDRKISEDMNALRNKLNKNMECELKA
ncbi:MAG TPA: site-specific integrase [Puia sp.]|nr:site-specific integrase [Puia sp.]